MSIQAERARTTKIEKAERRRTVLGQYAAGASVARIAEVNGLTEKSVHAIIEKAVKAYRVDTLKSVESIRVQQLTRLDELTMAVYPMAVGTETKPPNLAAVREVLRIEKMRTEIAGTGRAPERPAGGDVHLHIDASRVKELEQSFAASHDVDSTAEEIPAEVLGS